MDETGGITEITKSAGTTQVVKLQGYVFEQLKKAVGPGLKKPKKDGFSVDGMVEAATFSSRLRLAFLLTACTKRSDSYFYTPVLSVFPKTLPVRC